MTVQPRPNALSESYWMPFTAARAFREAPMMFVGAEGMHYLESGGRRVLDGMAGLWCVNAGHGHPRITEAIRTAAGQLDFVSSFRMGHPGAFAFAERLTAAAPEGLDHVFFSNSGSEAVDSALKIARAYYRVRGEGGRTKLVGRAKSYHGVGFGGLSVGGIGRHKRDFGPLLPDVYHLPLPYDPARMGFPNGRPAVGADYAESLEALLAVQDPSTVAAVIVEPVTGSGGVYPPPQGYLERLREICTKHGILLIFDEVITGFGRLGTCFASQAFGVTPDLIACAKGLTNGAVPMGATLVSAGIYEAFMAGPPEAVQLFHGYTYSGHPLACAAGLAALEAYEQEGIFANAAAMAEPFAQALHALRDAPHVVDIRTIGILGAIELAPRGGTRGPAVADRCFAAGVLVRAAGDMLVLSPPLILAPAEIDRIAQTIRDALLAEA
ncbi:aminotransferase class III-fold pyridoxal phosphate-dependent enzyme [Falsiroseomonas tokyonensis]|uniref:Aminotransferase class III-fold pyridoxal phosphate-dependent enzyme n=1 Tax=Falsiroseomonas tokyonensis TaxID=430521 RepID=A0ABV7C0E2_9PROT|nr:aminotransferase class III-fold pyridoxal phosphate-dependent enzyme [Falsiroseomonas tokyonensis]MBU8541142.1 aminotransferase class III-fold pyridoxal phosphate-dependent enzyme [Falsiroseomonas tokyonensis]